MHMRGPFAPFTHSHQTPSTHEEAVAGPNTRALPRRLRASIASGQSWCCAECNVPFRHGVFDVDHKVPYAIWPCHDRRNLRALCPTCHAIKSRAELSLIRRFQAAQTSRERICWFCRRHVSPYFFRGFACDSCAAATASQPVAQKSARNLFLEELRRVTATRAALLA